MATATALPKKAKAAKAATAVTTPVRVGGLSDDPARLLAIGVNLIDPSPYQPRKTFAPDEIEQLAASMQASGLLQPITVRSTGSEHRLRYELIAGERRLRAAKQLGWAAIPAIVKTVTDAEAATLATIENLQRADLSPLEEAQAFRRLMKEQRLSQQKLAEVLGIPRSTIGDRLGLLEIGPWLELLASGEITVSQAVELRRFKGATLGVHQEAIARARKSMGGKQGLAAIEVRTWPATLAQAYNFALWPIEASKLGYQQQPQFDVSGHDAECECGRVAFREYGTAEPRDHCVNPEWWSPRLDAWRKSEQAKGAAQPASRGTMVGGATFGATSGAKRGELRDDVVLQLPDNHGEPIEHRGWGPPLGVEILTDAAGRWNASGDPFDPADLVLANESLVEVRDYHAGARRVGTTDVDAVEAARATWEARWTARRAELRGPAFADCTLAGAGVRAFLVAAFELEDDDLPIAIRESAAARGVVLPEDVAREVAEDADMLPDAATRGWLTTAALSLVEAIASDYLRRWSARSGRYNDPAAKQVRAEQDAALEAIESAPVPWVIARPKLAGEQQDLLGADDETASDEGEP